MPEGRRIPRAAAQKPDLPPVDDAPPGPPGVIAALEKAGGELAALSLVIRTCAACGRAGDDRALGSGHPRARVLLVRDRPADEDARTGVAFSSEAESLERAFERLGMPLWWSYGASAVRCGTRAPTDGELHACSSHLLVEVEAIEPRMIVAFGDRATAAVRALDGRCGISVPAEVPAGEPVGLRPGLELLVTEPLPLGLTEPESKRRLWRDLQTMARQLR